MFETLKKYLGVIVYIFIILLFVFGCMNMKTHTGVKTGIKNSELVDRELAVVSLYKKASDNFVFLLKESEMFCGETLCKNLESTASGFVLHSDKTSIVVISAAHFCMPTLNTNSFSEKIHGFAGDQPRELFVIEMDLENDLCVLMGTKFKNDKFHSIKIAEKHTIGEDVYAIAAPLGIGGPGIRMIFDGKLAGCDSNGCITTIPATFGSSGAGIFNKKGELITIVMAVPQEFDHVVLSPSNQSLIKFIRDIDSKVDIYLY